MMMYIISALLSGIAVDLLLMWLLQQKWYPFMVVFSILSMFLLYKAFGENSIIIKGFLFSLILIFAGYHDAKTKTIPDMVHILIALTALIGFKPILSFVGAMLVPLPFLLAAVKKSGIGGGDIKLMAACGFLLGVYGGFIASIFGLTFAVTVNIVKGITKGNDKNVSFALAPYLGLGAYISFLIS